jgi:hypothetical protein
MWNRGKGASARDLAARRDMTDNEKDFASCLEIKIQ